MKWHFNFKIINLNYMLLPFIESVVVIAFASSEVFHLLTHLPNSFRTTSSSFARLVRLYSTLGGISGYIFLETRPSRSSSNSLSDNTVLLIPDNTFFSSLNRITSFVLKFFKINKDHLLPRTSHILATSHLLFPCLFLVASSSFGSIFILNTILIPITTYLITS